MATTTTYLSAGKPVPNDAGDADTWGTTQNTSFDTFDAGIGRQYACWLIPSVTDGSLTMLLNMRFPGEITKVTTKCTSGTATLTVKVGSTALGGTANSISTSEQSQDHSTTNTFSAGDDIVFTFSSASACVNASIALWINRTGTGTA